MQERQLLKPETLETEGYRLFNSFNHQDLLSFILPFMKYRNPFMMVFKAGAYLPVLALFIMMGSMLGSGTAKIEYLSSALLALAACVSLIPIHELLHGIAYKMVGAPKVSYGVIWKHLAFYALADRFVIGYRQFIMVGLAPYVTIGISMIIGMIFSNTEWLIFFLVILSIHNLLCVGDFALMSFLYENRYRELVTYDDKAEGKTYFYQKAIDSI